MANTIQIKRSNNASKTPGAGSVAALASGELAFNFAQNSGAGKLYFGNNSGNTTDITTVLSGITSAQLAGSIADSKLSTISTANKVSLSALNIDGGTAVSGGLASGDLIIVDDGAGGTNRKATLANLGTLLAGNGLAVSNAVLSVGVDDSTVELSSDAVRVKDGGITLAKLAADSVDGTKIADDAVDSEHLAAASIDQEHIALGQVVSGHLKSTDGQETVTHGVIRADAIRTVGIQDNAVTNDKIADDAVDTDQLADNAVTNAIIADNITLQGNCGSSGNFQVGGNLTVIGDTTTVNSTTVTVDDVVLTLGGDGTPALTTNDGFDRGIEFHYFRPTQANPGGEELLGFFGYDESTNKFTMLTEASVSSGDYSGTAGNLTIGSLQASSVTGATINGGTY